MISESTIVLLFICTVGGTFLFAAFALVRILLRRSGFLSETSTPKRRAEHLALIPAGLGILCVAYGYFIEPYWPQVSRVRIESGKLAGAKRPLRLIHISDLHCDPHPRLEQRLPSIIAAERPDAIVFTGDSLNSRDGLPVLKPLLTRLAEIAPTFVVRGNWDTWFWNKEDLFGGTGVKELRGAAEKLEVENTSFWITGIPVGAEHWIEESFNGIPPGAFTIFLHHYPDEILEIAKLKRADLYCAGHTHGGQVALPLYGALITLSRFGKKYEAGLYREGDTWLYVNRGIGMEGGSAPRVRFWSRPEVTVIELVPPSG